MKKRCQMNYIGYNLQRTMAYIDFVKAFLPKRRRTDCLKDIHLCRKAIQDCGNPALRGVLGVL